MKDAIAAIVMIALFLAGCCAFYQAAWWLGH